MGVAGTWASDPVPIYEAEAEAKVGVTVPCVCRHNIGEKAKHANTQGKAGTRKHINARSADN